MDDDMFYMAKSSVQSYKSTSLFCFVFSRNFPLLQVPKMFKIWGKKINTTLYLNDILEYDSILYLMDAYIRFTGPPTVLNNRYYDSINVLCKTTSKFILFPNISAGSILSNSNLILVDRRLNVCLCVCACVHACVFVCVCVCVGYRCSSPPL